MVRTSYGRHQAIHIVASVSIGREFTRGSTYSITALGGFLWEYECGIRCAVCNPFVCTVAYWLAFLLMRVAMSKLKLRRSSARAYESLFGSKPKDSSSGASTPSSHFCQVHEKVEKLKLRYEESVIVKEPELTSTLSDDAISIKSLSISSSTTRDDSAALTHKLISQKGLMSYFNHMLKSHAKNVIKEKLADGQLTDLTIEEASMARSRSEYRFGYLCDLPIKIILTPLNHGGKIVSRFAQLLEMQFGPLHAALQIGNVVLEWNDSSLVIPHYTDPSDPLLQTDVQILSRWGEITSTYYGQVREAIDALDYGKQIDLVFQFTAEKYHLFEALFQVIITYNTQRFYNLIDRNCQHFVADALSALGIDKPIEFTGGLRHYFEELKSGRAGLAFTSHAKLNEHVRQIVDNCTILGMPQHDLEYLLAQCFRFHLQQKDQMHKNADLSNWTCEEPNCCMQQLEKYIRFDTLRIHNFKTIDRPS